jgi:phosphatidylserine/phosphatidylglycerophosphate/cardiolipin synthase-like enzyme
MARRPSTRRRVLGLLLVAVVALLGLRAARPGTQPAVARLPDAPVAAAAADQLLVEPDDGMAPIDAMLSGVRRSLDMTMYELTDPTIEGILADDAARGVRVRVLLDGRLERSHNTSAYDYLRARGVTVRWSSSRFFVTHQKSFVVDDRTAVVMSLNLASRYYATTRDVAVVDHDPRDVAAIESVFVADLDGHGTGTPAADDLAWSPGQSAADMLALIRSARTSISLESEEMSDPSVISALLGAAHRGVHVTVVMTYQSDWATAFDRLLAAGCRVVVLHGESPRYIHAKILAVDAGRPDQRVLVGSQNISTTSLQHDRELGIVLLQPRLVGELAALVATDAAAGEPWQP